MNNPLKPKKRKRRIDSKYRPKFARELREGLRADGMSKSEVCVHFGISLNNYNQWEKSIPAFAEACAIGERDYQAWWAKTYRQAACGEIDGNAGLLKYAATNVLGWAEKSESKVSIDEEVRIIEIIEVTPPKRIIEHEDVQKLEHYAEENRSTINTESESILQPVSE